MKSGLSQPGSSSKDEDHNILEEELYKQIGKLKVEVDWLKKKIGLFS